MSANFLVCLCFFKKTGYIIYFNIHNLSPRCLWFKHVNHEFSRDLCKVSLERRQQWTEDPAHGCESIASSERFTSIFQNTNIQGPAWETLRVTSWLKKQLCSLFQPQISMFLQDRYWKKEVQKILKKNFLICNHPSGTGHADLSKTEHHLQ